MEEITIPLPSFLLLIICVVYTLISLLKILTDMVVLVLTHKQNKVLADKYREEHKNNGYQSSKNRPPAPPSPPPTRELKTSWSKHD